MAHITMRCFGLKSYGLFVREICGEFFFFQQGIAPAHQAHETINVLERETSAFISSNLLAPNSKDLNPVDYKMSGEMQQRDYQVRDDELKQRLIDVFHGFEWRKRFRACILVKGHVKHLI